MEDLLEEPLTPSGDSSAERRASNLIAADHVSSQYVGRLAPSPTGALHLGNVRTFMIAWLRARSQGGRMLFRMEDLDHPKDKPGAAAQAVEDLRWLGFDWDAEDVQSRRREIYRAALASLRAAELVYPCVCSRKDVESAQSAPHAGEQLYYPGTCRGRFATWRDAVAYRAARVEQGAVAPLPCWRFRVTGDAHVAFDDVFAGPFEQDVASVLGDFPLARDADGAGYTLAATVDDLLTGVTEVVRGDDLLAATPAQILLAHALLRDFKPLAARKELPAYCHVPLVVGPDGRRLAKRHGDTRIASLRAAGIRPAQIIGRLAATCGWCEKNEEISLADLVPRFDLKTIPSEPCTVGRDFFKHLIVQKGRMDVTRKIAPGGYESSGKYDIIPS